ncbi:MAG: RsmE family RNA methyltransferase [Firmicutes bacterium]|nr:RsmE family RNA methyltransferase [Bacillota bacterium]
MSRFFVSPENIGEDNIIIDNREDLHHMVKVLRLSAGDEIDVSDSSQWEYRCEILSVDADSAVARIVDKQKFTAEPDVKVTLFQGIPKQGKMEVIVQKCVELGVESIVPVFMARTVVVDKGNFGKKIQRWQKVSDEAVKQCRRGIIPQVQEPVRTAEAIKQFDRFDLVLFPYENEDGRTIKDELRNCGAPGNVAVIIGPEGGFSDEEAGAIVNAGGRSVSLGKTTLRTETAGMAAIAMIMYELEL